MPICGGSYSDVMPGIQEEAAEKIDAGLRKTLAGQAIVRPSFGPETPGSAVGTRSGCRDTC
jgi:hypothetical protein